MRWTEFYSFIIALALAGCRKIPLGDATWSLTVHRTVQGPRATPRCLRELLEAETRVHDIHQQQEGERTFFLFKSVDGLAGSIGPERHRPDSVSVSLTSINVEPTAEVAKRMCADALRIASHLDKCATFAAASVEVDDHWSIQCKAPSP